MSRVVKDIMVFDEELAKKTYFDFVGDVTEYYFCSHHDCNKLVYSKDHQSKTHKWACTEKHRGIVSKQWKTNSPKVIPISGFDFTKQEYFSSAFFKYLHDDSNVSTTCSCGNKSFNGTVCCFCHVDINDVTVEEKSKELQGILALQADQYESSAMSTAIGVVNQQLTPNLWLFHTGWDKMLDGYTYANIYEFVHAVPNDNENVMINAMMETLDAVVEAVKKIEPMHQIMSDVQRRTKYLVQFPGTNGNSRSFECRHNVVVTNNICRTDAVREIMCFSHTAKMSRRVYGRTQGPRYFHFIF